MAERRRNHNFRMSIISVILFSVLSFLTGTAQPGDPQGADLVFVGDAMQHQAQLDRAKELGGKGYDYTGCFTLIAPEITRADYAVCNLEVPLGGGPDYSGFPCFSAPDSYAKALKDAGFDMFLTANNHCLDRRDKGARATLKALDRLGVDHIGTYNNATERRQKVPFVKNVNGIKIGFLNYTYGTNGIEPNDGIEVSLIDRKRMAEEIAATRKAGAEIVCVTVHWGTEYVLLPGDAQKSLAQFLADQGVDLIIGGHPHVIQPMEVLHNNKEGKDVLLVYSLGNFISNMKTDDTRGGALVKVRVERDQNGKARFKKAEYDLIFTEKPTGGRTNYRVIPSGLMERLPASQRGAWKIFERNARRVFDAHNKGVPAVK